MEKLSIASKMDKLCKVLELENLSDIKVYEEPNNWIKNGIIATSGSLRHINHLSYKLKKLDFGKSFIEGSIGSGWIIIEFEFCTTHIFLKETRDFYDLDGLWKINKIKNLEKDMLSEYNFPSV